jgi:hypothetical protein
MAPRQEIALAEVLGLPLAAAVTFGALFALWLPRSLAVRRLAAGDPRLIRFVFPIPFIAGGALVAIALANLGRQPAMAVVTGVVLLVLAGRLVLRLRRAISAAPAPPDVLQILMDEGSDYLLGLIGLMLLTGLIGGVALVIAAAAHAL